MFFEFAGDLCAIFFCKKSNVEKVSDNQWMDHRISGSGIYGRAGLHSYFKEVISSSLFEN
jgi:hypothetical protein